MESIRPRSWLVLCTLLAALAGDGPAAASAPPARTTTPAPRTKPTLRRPPLFFVENRGQTDERVSHYVAGRDESVFFTAQGVTYSLAGDGRRYAVKYDFVGADPDVRPRALDKTPAVISHFRGKRSEWKTGLATFSTLVYADLWPGIDLTYTAGVDQLKYAFTVRPGADPAQIRIACRGADSLRVTAAGDLTTTTPVATLTDSRPISFQETDGLRADVASAFVLAPRVAGAAPSFGFKVGAYDATRALTIDPAVFVYGGFIGGSRDEEAFAVAVDADGNAYVAGSTGSDDATFPATPGFAPEFRGGNNDAFVAKVKADGSGLVYAGFLGGDGREWAYGIAVDTDGGAYVVGETSSSAATFPVAVGPALTYTGSYTGFVAKVNAAGTSLVYCGYVGSVGHAVAVDGTGHAYVTGEVASNAVLAVVGGLDDSANGSTDAFVAKVKADGSGLDYAGHLGGVEFDLGTGIAVTADGVAYVTGETYSDATTFPEAVGPDLTYGGGTDCFVARVNAAGSALDWCSYVGGSGSERGGDVDIDATGVYVVGTSDGGAFPAVPGFDATHNGDEDVFVTKLSLDGAAFVYAGYLGGSVDETGVGIAVDAGGRAFITGTSEAPGTGFPATNGPDATHGTGDDAFVAAIDAAGTSVLYAGFIGGSGGLNGTDVGRGIAVDAAGNAFVVGVTESSQATFPVLTGPDTSINGQMDAFLVKVAGIPLPPTPVSINAFLLPKSVTVKTNAKLPAKSTVTISGVIDEGSGSPDYAAASTLEVGNATFPIDGMTLKGRVYTFAAPGILSRVTPAKTASSRGSFTIVRTGDVSGEVDKDGDLKLRLFQPGFDAVGVAKLVAGKFKLGKVRGGLIIPCIFPSSVVATLKGAGKDTLTLVAGFALPGYPVAIGGPGDVPAVTIAVGGTYTATIDRAAFVPSKKGDKLTFKGNVNGITSVVIDFKNEKITVKGSRMSLVGVAAASGPVAITMTLDTLARGVDMRTVTVSLNVAGKSLKY